MNKGLYEQLTSEHIQKYDSKGIMAETQRYLLYTSILLDKELYDSTEGHRLIDILTNGSELDIILVQEILDARKNTL